MEVIPEKSKRGVVKKTAVKKKSGPSAYNDARWLKAVNLFIESNATGAKAAMVKVGFSESFATKRCDLLKKHPVYLEWVKAKTKKNLITKAYLERKLYAIIEENGRDRVSAIGKAMEMFGFIAPKQVEVAGKDGKPIAFTFGDANLKPYVPDTKNRIAKYN